MIEERFASFDSSGWLPAYAWWPPTDEFAVTVVLSTHASTVEEEGRYAVTIRAYDGARDPVWEHDAGEISPGQYGSVSLNDLGLPGPNGPHGGILEVHTVRTDAAPDDRSMLWQWIDAEGIGGGGFLIPCSYLRGAGKFIRRDDLQVAPGVVAGPDLDTDIVLLNPHPTPAAVRLVLAGPDGLSADASYEIPPWSTWRDVLTKAVPRSRRLLAPSDGIGSLAIYSPHKIMPFFGTRGARQPVSAMDHTAPIFG